MEQSWERVSGTGSGTRADSGLREMVLNRLRRQSGDGLSGRIRSQDGGFAFNLVQEAENTEGRMKKEIRRVGNETFLKHARDRTDLALRRVPDRDRSNGSE